MTCPRWWWTPPRRAPRAPWRGAVVEKQSGVEVVGEVHEETARAFAHLVKCAGLVELFVLPAAFLATPDLEEHLFARDLEHQWNYPERVLQALACLVGIDGVRRFIFLYMHVTLREPMIKFPPP